MKGSSSGQHFHRTREGSHRDPVLVLHANDGGKPCFAPLIALGNNALFLQRVAPWPNFVFNGQRIDDICASRRRRSWFLDLPQGMRTVCQLDRTMIIAVHHAERYPRRSLHLVVNVVSHLVWIGWKCCARTSMLAARCAPIRAANPPVAGVADQHCAQHVAGLIHRAALPEARSANRQVYGLASSLENKCSGLEGFALLFCEAFPDTAEERSSLCASGEPKFAGAA